MRIVRGSLSDAEDDGAVTRRLADHVEASGEPALRVWTPPRQVAFGRRDAIADGYEAARAAAVDRGYEPVERSVGGRAVAYTGGTVAFAYAVTRNDDRDGIQTRYEEVTDLLQRACRDLGATVRSGEPDGTFCPGDHSLQNGGKIAGIAQRVRRETALVGGCVVAVERDEAGLAAVLEPVYDALDVRFDPDSVGSVEGAGGPGDVDRVVAAIEGAFVGDRDADVVAAPDLVDGAP